METNNDQKLKRMFKRLLMVLAVLAFVFAFVRSLRWIDKGQETVDILLNTGVIVAFSATLCIMKGKHIRQWFQLVTLWMCCSAAGLLLAHLIKGVSVDWIGLAIAFLIAWVVNFVAGLILGGFFWAFSD